IEGNKKSYNVTNVLPETAYVIKMAAFSEYGRSVDVSYSHRTASTRRKGKGPVPFDQSLQTTTSTRWSTHITSLERTTESPGQKLQQFVEGMDMSNVARPEDLIAVTSDINDIINGHAESPLPSSVLKSTADLVSDLADAMKGSQGASVQNMGTIANALVQTASAVVDMLPEPETPIGSTADNLFGSYIDINNADLSPKQQLKILKDKQKEKTMLSSSKKDIQLDSDHIVVDIPGRETQTTDMLDVKMSVFNKNPYSWAESTGGQNISSPVVFFTMKTNEPGSLSVNKRVNLNLPFLPSQPRGHPTAPPPLDGAIKQPNAAKVDASNGKNMTYHAFTVPKDNSVPVVRLDWWDVDAIFHVFTAYGSLPTPEKFAEKRVVQEEGYEAWLKGTNFSMSFIPNTTHHGGRLYVGVQRLGAAKSTHGHPQQRLEESVHSADKKDYTLSMSSLGCSSWKDNKKQWGPGDCDVAIDLKAAVVSCKCSVTESSIAVGTMTLPLPNSINFSNAFKNFRNISDNAVVFSTVVCEYILYILVLGLCFADFQRIRATIYDVPSVLYYRITGRKRVTPLVHGAAADSKRRKGLSKVNLIPPDRMPAPHVYQLTVTTGAMFGAGTASRVAFQLYGSEGTTPVKMLNPGGEELVRGSTLHFIMPVRESLGEVMLLHIWHENSGEGDTASWFLGTFVVRDVEKDVVSYFICNDWLSEARVTTELSAFSNVFSQATRDVLYDKQLWASALVGAPGSSFTKAQRLSCCFTLLNTMMLSSAMWYAVENTTAGAARVYNLGFVRFSLQELYISLMSVLTVVPVNLVIAQLFRMEAPLTVDSPEMKIRTSKQGRLQKYLSRWAANVAWLTVFLVSTSSAFFVLLYSMDWGKEKSDAWMKTFILSFMGSSCVIFVLAAVLAVVCSLPFLAKPPAIRQDDLKLSLWNTTVPKKLRRPAKVNLQSAKKKRELRKKSASTLMEFLLLFVFVALLFYIAQMDKEPLAFHSGQSLSNNILNEYDSIKTPDQFYSWLEEVLLPTLYPSSWYNGRRMKYLDRQFAHNTESFRIGPPRLTQTRQGPVTKEKSAGHGWNVLPGNMSCNSWRFSIPNLPNHRNYTSNCHNRHSVNFPLDYDTAVSFIRALRDSEYLDKHTKSVTIDINFYNPSLKLFSVVHMITVRSGIGNLMPTATITPFRLFQYESDNDYVSLFLHVIFTLLFLVLLCKEVKAWLDEGWSYCSSPWNAVAWASLMGTATAISVFIKRYAVSADTLDMVANTNGELGFVNFVDLTAAAWWDACFKHILGIVVFINTIALLRVVRFSQTISKLLALPGIMKEELLSFLVVAGIAFAAFISSGHLVFGGHMESYLDLYHTTFALFEMMLGRFFANEMLDSNPVTGPIFFSSFMICIFILLMNFLMTIVCDAISADVDVSHDRDLGEYMWRSFRAMLGFPSPPNKEEDKTGASKMEDLQANLRDLQERLDTTLNICDSVLPSHARGNRNRLDVKAQVSQHIHIESPGHSVSLEGVKILDSESDFFARGVKEAVYIRAHRPTLNRDGGRHKLSGTYDPLLRSRVSDVTFQE
ncbi:hypothetical protein Bbelb_083360, partial [Branchiostoma belcheri]